jgi:CheY-like chemotaxis protein
METERRMIGEKEVSILVVDDNDFNIYSLQQILEWKFGLLSLSVRIP